MSICPCGSGHNYADCCEPFILGHKEPEVPEQLMRARYSAYVKKDVGFIARTVMELAAEDFAEDDAKNWMDQVTWLQLTVIKAPQPTAEKGFVEFMARFVVNGTEKTLHEISEFRCHQDKWYYYDGKYPKTGRNDPCPCGSGKKFKKCCGG